MARRSREGPRPRPRSTGEHFVAGARAVLELLDADPGRVRRIFVERGREFPEVTAAAEVHGLDLEPRERNELSALVGEGLARGLVAVADPPPERELDELLDRPAGTRRGRRLVVALDEVVDPANLGAIVRSAEFFGAAGVVWARDRSAPLSALAVRASAGATERLPLCRVTNLARALQEAKDAGFWVVGTLADEGTPLDEAAHGLPDALVVVLGGEERGLRALTRQRCDFLVNIPGAGEMGSLNVSAAAAVVLATLS